MFLNIFEQTELKKAFCPPYCEADHKHVYEITIKHKDKGTKTYEIYTKEEADTSNISYKPWKEAEIGEYALSDDNYVAEVIQRKEYKGENGVNNVYIRVPWGYSFHSPKYDSGALNAEGRLSNHTLTGKPQLEVRKGNATWKALALAYTSTWRADLAIDLVFPDATKSKQRTMKRWMRTQEFKSMVQDEIKGLLSEKGYGEVDVIDLLTKAKSMAEDKKDITNFLRVVENIQDMLGMRDKTIIKTTQKLEAHATRKLLDEIAEEEATLIGTKETIEVRDGVSAATISKKEE